MVENNGSFTYWRFFSQFMLIGMLAISTLSGCAGNTVGLDDELEFDSTTFSFDQGTYPSELGLFSLYRLSPGDVLDVLFQIQTWVEQDDFRLAVDHTIEVKFLHTPELNEKQRVHPDGKIALPYVGEIYVVGKSVAELTELLKQAFSAELVNPELYVMVPEFQEGIKELKKDLHTAPRGLSRLVTVRPDGYVTFPMVGDVFVANQTLPQIRSILDGKYQEILPSLHVDLFLEKHSASLIYVLGDVNKVGGYKITRPTSILEALALAEGSLPSAALDKVVVFRQHNRKYVGHRLNLEQLMALNTDNSFFHLRPDDIVYVPKRGLSAAASIMEDVRSILMFRGWSIGVDGPLFDKPLIRN
ncbi:MAG TPA: polysaccharide biosynthesis/export family protein [Malonomonas sp.]